MRWGWVVAQLFRDIIVILQFQVHKEEGHVHVHIYILYVRLFSVRLNASGMHYVTS